MPLPSQYYANTGALLSAARSARRGAPVACSVVEAFGGDASTPRELDDVLRMEYRTKLLNPRWAEAMAAQGSGGAYEISQRMTALIGWGATSGFKDAFVYDSSYELYVEDEQMAERLRSSNLAAWSNVGQARPAARTCPPARAACAGAGAAHLCNPCSVIIS